MHQPSDPEAWRRSYPSSALGRPSSVSSVINAINTTASCVLFTWHQLRDAQSSWKYPEELFTYQTGCLLIKQRKECKTAQASVEFWLLVGFIPLIKMQLCEGHSYSFQCSQPKYSKRQQSQSVDRRVKIMELEWIVEQGRSGAVWSVDYEMWIKEYE